MFLFVKSQHLIFRHKVGHRPSKGRYGPHTAKSAGQAPAKSALTKNVRTGGAGSLPLPRGKKPFTSQGIPGGGVLRYLKWAEQAKNAMLSPFLTLFEILSELVSEIQSGKPRPCTDGMAGRMEKSSW